MFEVDGQKLSNQEVEEAYQRKFGKPLNVRSPLWMKVVVVAFFLLVVSGWKFSEKTDTSDAEHVSITQHVEFLGWKLPAYKTELLSHRAYLDQQLENGNLKIDHDVKQFYVKGNDVPIDGKSPLKSESERVSVD